LGATLPVAQYGNLQPTIEVEADTIDEALALALGHIKTLWDRTVQKPLEIGQDTLPTGKVLQCRVSGAEVIFDPIAHTYHDRQGNQYQGGSTFAGRFKAPFPGEIIAGKMAIKHGVEAQKILDMWALNAEASSTFGTSVHAALQLYGEYLDLSRSVKDGSDESALTANPVLRPIVEAFFTEERRAEKAFYEEFVADSRTRSCGLIDRLVADDDGLWVEDFKTNTSVDKSETILEPFKDVIPHTSLGAFLLQLSYYAKILIDHGRIVKGLRIHHFTGSEWITHEHPVVDLTPAFKEAA
jgi:hypothetical protein